MLQGKTAVLKRDLVSGFENGLAVIEAFDAAHPRLTLTDVARIAGLTRAAARRYLLTLTTLGYAEHDGKFFSLTPKILRLGYAFLSSTSLPARVQPYLEQISEQLSESSSAAVLDHGEVVYIARTATRRIMSIGLSVGSRLPAYCTSLGRALLAYQEPAHLTDYFAQLRPEPLTPKTKTSIAAIQEELATVRLKGYCLVDEELEIGLRSLSVPIFGGDGRVVCAINVSVQTARLDSPRLLDTALPPLFRARDDLRRVL
jgi:IclR family pca regulon transcriptional regulator